MKIYTNEMIKKIKDKKQKRRKIIKICLTPLFIIILFLCIYIIYQKFILKKNNIDLFGFKTFIVLTGSMEPTISINDLILIKEVKEDEIKVNDIITFHLNNSNSTITHRIVEKFEIDGTTYYKTKGDNNNANDSDKITYKNIDGLYIFKMNKVGVILTEIFTGTGLIILFLILAVSYFHSSRMEDRELARADARKQYNVCKYKKDD